MRRLHLVVTIGGGFLGIALILQEFFAAKEFNLVVDALYACFIGMYGYGVFAGFRLVEDKEQTKHLTRFYCLQVPWISSPIVGYRFTSGFYLSVAILGGQLNGSFHIGINWTYRIGGEWWFSLFRSAPWSIGVNVFALVMALILMRRKKQIQSPEPPLVMPAAAEPPHLP